MIDRIQALMSEAKQSFLKAQTSQELYDCKVQFLGKSGSFSGLMKEMGKLSAEERPIIGKKANEAKVELESVYSQREAELKRQELNKQLESERVDVTLPGLKAEMGHRHPIHMVLDEMIGIFAKMGFAVRTGPQIESDFYNFESLNIPPDHSSRDMQDTFYVRSQLAGNSQQAQSSGPGSGSGSGNSGGQRGDTQWVLRTHTSPIQIRSMKTEKLPFRVIGPGAVYRSDSDVSHSPNFHQLEGFLVDQNVSMADLKGTLSFFAKEFFGSEMKVRFRPSYFPFTEPSAEVDASCQLCKGSGCRMCGGSGWIEIGGCGMTHPNVFKAAGVEYPKWNGFAFGMGIERMAVVKYGVEDIRLFVENDLRFLRQFPS